MLTQRRGRQYFRENRVVKLAADANGLHAVVRGSMDYQVRWYEQRREWWSECTCPVGVDCKHAYAAAEKILQSAAAPPPDNPLMDAQIDRWMGFVNRAAKPPAPPVIPVKSTTMRLIETQNEWEAFQLMPTLLKEMGLQEKWPGNRWLTFMEAANPDRRAWLLARQLLKFGDHLPPELEPYRHHAAFEREERTAREKEIAASFQHWIQESSGQPIVFERSLRVVWTWDRRSAPGSGPRINFLLNSKKLKNAPRAFQQVRNLLNDAMRVTGRFSPEDVDFLRWLDSQQQLLRRHLPYDARSDSPRSEGRALHAWLATWGRSSRCVWEDDSPVRYHPTTARIVPEIFAAPPNQTETETIPPRLGLAVEIPELGRFPLCEARVVLPQESDPENDPPFVFIHGNFHQVTAAPPRSLLLPLLEGLDLPLSERYRAQLVPSLLAKFPNLGGGARDLVRYHPVRCCFTFALHPNDWLCARLHATASAGNLGWEWTSRGWARADLPPADAANQPIQPVTAMETGTTSASTIPSAGGAADAPLPSRNEKDRAHLPAPAVAEPCQQWLQGLGLQAAVEAGLPEKPGWWIFLNAARMELLIEQWRARPASAEYQGNAAFRDLVRPGQRSWPKLRIQSSGVDWFTVSSEWESIAGGLTNEDLARLRDSSTQFVKLANGRWIHREETGELQAALETLADLGIDPLAKEPQQLTLWQMAGAGEKALGEWLARLESAGDSETRRTLEQLRNRLTSFQGLPEVKLPQRLRATLRPYQLDGLKFLAHAPTLKLGSILADDMGLGKTVQALAWLEHFRDLDGPAPCLVVCPASVVYNWQREAEKFVPGMTTLLLASGAGRHGLRKEIPRHDLIITNYALLRRDLEELKQFEFRAVILDEAQNIKNPDALVARAAKQLKAAHRLALTGTPLENRLLDLWSIVDFVAPGYLGTRGRFTETYDTPDQPHRRRLLTARLRPILLRRIKREVAPELPERIEERQDCELTAEQRLLYLGELQRFRKMVSDFSGEDELRRKKIHVLAALTRLRQICCHPALVGGKPDIGSGKTTALFDILDPLIAEGHKVLVFSQFVRMLQLLQGELRQRSIPYHLLTGQTTKREAVVEAFQNDPQAAVFLLSLRAAGTGLNLTAASYVVLYDPWWNPAVEAQAIDRTHRIGQDRTVITYRLVAKGTVEDKIYELQQRKAAVVKDVLGEQGFARSLTHDDLQFLLADEPEEAS